MTQNRVKRFDPCRFVTVRPVVVFTAAIVAICGFLFSLPAPAGEVMPPAPPRYFNDFAGATKPGTSERLNNSLEQFEKDTSSQIVVAVFPKMQTDSSIEDYVNRMFRAWKIGQQKNNNGVLFAVFTQDRKMRIEVGYGLEGAIPDAIARRIIDNEVAPRFRNQDFDGGLTAGVNSLMRAARGEYKGNGRTRANTAPGIPRWFFPYVFPIGIVLLAGLTSLIFSRRGTTYGSRRYSSWNSPFTWSGAGGDGGGFSSGGGGDFSGGGGSSGGGGASGSW